MSSNCKKLPNNRVKAEGTPVPMSYLRRLKEAIVSHGIHLPFVKKMLNSWSVCNIPKDWIDLDKTLSYPGS